jgi:hypothetical protein
MSDVEPYKSVPGPGLVAAAGWAVPGLGYVLIGEKVRGLVAGITILFLFVFGCLIGGVRVVDVPGFTGDGQRITAPGASPLQMVFDKPWFVPQILTGMPAVVASYASVAVSADYVRTTARLWDIGTLYCAIAGMLNLLILIDAAHRSARIRDDDPSNFKMPSR